MKIKNKDLGTFLVVLALISGAYVLYSQFIVNPVSQEFANWTQAGSEITTAKINEPTTLNLNIYAASPLGFSGIIKVQIKKDVAGTSDLVAITKSVPVNIPPGFGNNKQTISVTFTPNEAAGGGIDRVREYFYKVYVGEVSIYDPQTSGDRNGLLVADKAISIGDPSAGIPKVQGILFNGAPQITVAPNTAISTKVSLIGKGTGVLKVEIRRDIEILPDDSYAILQKQVTVDGSGIIDMPTWTAQAQGIGFREYFGKVWWNDNLIYDPQNPLSREYVRIGSGGITPTPTPTPTITPIPTPTASVSFNAIELKSVSGSGMKINVPVGTLVEVYVTVTTNAATTGNLLVEVRKDMELLPDTTLTTLSKSVGLKAGQNTIMVGSFSASDLTSVSFRQYFFRTNWNNVVIDAPSDPNTRESVTTTSSGGGSSYKASIAVSPVSGGMLSITKNGQFYGTFAPTTSQDRFNLELGVGETFTIVPVPYANYMFSQICDNGGLGQCLTIPPIFTILQEDLGKTDNIVVFFAHK